MQKELEEMIFAKETAERAEDQIFFSICKNTFNSLDLQKNYNFVELGQLLLDELRLQTEYVLGLIKKSDITRVVQYWNEFIEKQELPPEQKKNLRMNLMNE